MLSIVWICIFMFLLIALVFIAGTFYGMSDCDTIGQWLKEERDIIKETNQEMKAEKAFIKANPLCSQCQTEGKYHKSTRMWTKTDTPIALCDQHYLETRTKYYES